MKSILKFHGKRNDDDYDIVDGDILDYGEKKLENASMNS